MPELPEVETIARALRPALVGRPISGLRVSGMPLRLRRPIPARALERAVAGARVVAVTRRAKYLLLELSSQFVVLVHLGMSGRLTLAPASVPPSRHTHVVFALDRDEELRFVDPRRFGLVAVYPREQLDLSPELRGLGADPLDPAFTPEALLQALQATHGCSIKAFLLNQRRVAGVGNIYACEALFLAGIHPQASADRLSPARARKLHRGLKRTLTRAVSYRGTTFRDYRDPLGESGENQYQLQVYMREGERCKRCGRTLRRLVQQARSTFYCPGCQRV
jgi:formamidopyrimidine-DNA glycosylase